MHCIIVSLAWIVGSIGFSSSTSTKDDIYPFSMEQHQVDCPTFDSKWITQLNIPWGSKHRAYHTIPPELSLRPSTIEGAGLGIFSNTFIAKNTWLGEYEGETIISRNLISDYAFVIYREGGEPHYTDAYDVALSSWTRWVNCARSYSEENVRYLNCCGRVYFILTNDVWPGQELMFYYGDSYAEYLGIDYRTKNQV